MISIQQLSNWFDQAVELKDENAQDRFIEQHCFDMPEQAAKLRRMIQAHAERHQLLDNPTNVMVCAAEESCNLDRPQEGSIIGNYKLLEMIGQGGMGLVYMAEQQHPIRRRVALKIIHANLNSSQVLARFEAEREALSRLDHPNITRILDAGTTTAGRPYFVMELVRGTSITEYSDRHQASIEERLALMEQTCRAVHHAHQKGIIHRDLKPSNIMVTLHDGQPVPKVIDFGIAKALDRPLTEKTLFTRYGDMIGTPQYMSPEQAEMSGLDLDAHTDVYSLGVILYELLTGSTPIEAETLNNKGLLGVFQTIRDCEAETPSIRVTKTMTRDEQVAHRRKTTSKMLQRCIVGELDWITLKALSKTRAGRYESAAAMARDLRAYLDGEPVDAAAPSFWYQSTKFYRRHKAICLTALVSILCLFVMTTLSAYWALANARLKTLAQERSDELGEKSHTLEMVNAELRQALQRASIAEAEATRLADRERRDGALERALSHYALEQIQFNLQQLPIPTPAEQTATLVQIQPGIDVQTGNDISAATFKTSQLVVEAKFMLGDSPAFNGEIHSPEIVKVGEPLELDYATKLLLHVQATVQGLGGEGETLFDRILEELRKEFGNEHAVVADHLLVYGRYLMEKGGEENLLKAENQIRDSLAILSKQAPESISRLEGLILLARLLLPQDRIFQAEGVLKEVDAAVSQFDPDETGLTEEDARRLKSARAEFETLEANLINQRKKSSAS